MLNVKLLEHLPDEVVFLFFSFSKAAHTKYSKYSINYGKTRKIRNTMAFVKGKISALYEEYRDENNYISINISFANTHYPGNKYSKTDPHIINRKSVTAISTA